MIDEWLHLTDRYGGEMHLRRQLVKAFYYDSVVVPDADKGMRTLFGTTVILDGGDTYFAIEDLDTVKASVFALE